MSFSNYAKGPDGYCLLKLPFFGVTPIEVEIITIFVISGAGSKKKCVTIQIDIDSTLADLRFKIEEEGLEVTDLIKNDEVLEDPDMTLRQAGIISGDKFLI